MHYVTQPARLGRKMKTSPANGSARSACCTKAANPSMPLRKCKRYLSPTLRAG